MDDVYPFVDPELVRLPLPGNHFLDVKKELNAGEHRRVFAQMVRDGYTPGQKTVLDPFQVGLTKLNAYIVGWSFVDKSGKPVPFSEAALLNCNQDMFRTIVEAIEGHEQRQEEVRAEWRKKTLGGGNGSSPTSESPAP